MPETTRRGFFGLIGAALAAVGVGRRVEAEERMPLGQEPCAWDFTGNPCRYEPCGEWEHSSGPTLEDCMRRGAEERGVLARTHFFDEEAMRRDIARAIGRAIREGSTRALREEAGR